MILVKLFSVSNMGLSELTSDAWCRKVDLYRLIKLFDLYKGIVYRVHICLFLFYQFTLG